jgi:hypothetical protein
MAHPSTAGPREVEDSNAALTFWQNWNFRRGQKSEPTRELADQISSEIVKCL